MFQTMTCGALSFYPSHDTLPPPLSRPYPVLLSTSLVSLQPCMHLSQDYVLTHLYRYHLISIPTHRLWLYALISLLKEAPGISSLSCMCM
ncbi:hypothetical protein BDN71DRAFT_1203035 [Pleurotus eryngii]|uniref:Uncharacterized protein n=1 Tax=Pleurotus eryngii TaxID=5323 RepID=A0A9P6DD55_PLEER|nr:hypothetical protein BDN71DRAFT_1203035 [Pleurotus eryngii]